MEFPVEWDPVQNTYIEIENYEHMEILIGLNSQVEEHIQTKANIING